MHTQRRAQVGEELHDVTLILASDGVWDLWEYDEAFDAIMRAPGAPDDADGAARTFFRDSLARGVETFEDTADNMTAIVVYLGDDVATPTQPAEPAIARARDAAGSPRAGSPGRALSGV